MIPQGPVINGWCPVSVVIFLCVYDSLSLVSLLFCFSLHLLLTWAPILQLGCTQTLVVEGGSLIAVGFEISVASRLHAFHCTVEVLHCKLLGARALSVCKLPSPQHGAIKQINTGVTFISAQSERHLLALLMCLLIFIFKYTDCCIHYLAVQRKCFWGKICTSLSSVHKNRTYNGFRGKKRWI